MRHPKKLSISCPNTIVIALCSLLVITAGAAQAANPEVILQWIQKNGSSIAPTTEVIAVENDVLVLEVLFKPGDAGLQEFGFSVRFDDDGKKELDLGVFDDPPEGDQGGWEYFTKNWDLSTTTQDSVREPGASDAWGQVGSYQGCTAIHEFGFECEEGGGLITSSEPVSVGTITFEVTSYVASDGADIKAGKFNFTHEYFVLEYDAVGPVELCEGPQSEDCTEVTFGTATVPEPAHAMLQLGALLAIALLAGPTRRISRARG